MQENWIEVNVVFRNYAVGKHAQSVKASLVTGSLVVTEVNQRKLKSFDTNAEKEECINSLKHRE